jgi:UDP-N-acetylglucosamine transferase subunit ALG13
MIFLTVGTQLPFDRLVRSVDRWCEQNNVSDVMGQLALRDARQGYQPHRFRWVSFMEPHEFDHHFDIADMIVAHAGMGSIITAIMKAKPILVLPRRAALGEQRNDHQLATVERIRHREGVFVARAEDDVPTQLEVMREWCARDRVTPPDARPHADKQLISELRCVITSRACREKTRSVHRRLLPRSHSWSIGRV